MPNHVQNKVFFSGDPERIRQMLEQIQNEEYGIGTIDFNKIIPMPEETADPYSWHVINWDTKWNAYNYQPGKNYSRSEMLDFWTANTAPHSVIARLAEMFPDIVFSHEWADEDIGINCGRRSYQDGERCEEYEPETDKECVEFACGVWGETSDSMGYVFHENTQSYVYEESEETETMEQGAV